MSDPENSQRTDPHECPVGFACIVPVARERRANRIAAVKRFRLEPGLVCLPDRLRVGPALVDRRPRLHQGHFGIVGQLPGKCLEGPAILHLADTVRILFANPRSIQELDLTAERIAAELSQQATLSA